MAIPRALGGIPALATVGGRGPDALDTAPGRVLANKIRLPGVIALGDGGLWRRHPHRSITTKKRTLPILKRT
jgi:hypothetical protein